MKMQAVMSVVLTASLMCACSDGSTVPSGPVQDSDSDFSETMHLLGRITSSADATPISDATISVSDHDRCDYWAHSFGGCSWKVAETTTDATGSFDGTFTDELCYAGKQLQLTIWAKGFQGVVTTIECVGSVQEYDVKLDVVPISVSLSFPTTVTVGQPVTVGFTTYARDGLVMLSMLWGDASEPDELSLTGIEAEGELSHTYTEPGEYIASVTVSDTMGQTETATTWRMFAH